MALAFLFCPLGILYDPAKENVGKSADLGSNITKLKSLLEHLVADGTVGGDHWQTCFLPCLAGISQDLWWEGMLK